MPIRLNPSMLEGQVMHAQNSGSIARFGIAHFATTMVLSMTVAAAVCSGASPDRLAGSLAGSVRDSSGIPQMGAVVQLYNRNDKLIEKALTSAAGEFTFASLIPDIYSI